MALSIVTTYTIITCPSCGVPFGITDDYRERRESDGRSFYCPNQHYMSYTDSTEKKLKRAKDQLAAERSRHEQTRAELDHTEARRRATKGQLTKVKNRVAKGVCPCCNRSFGDLAAHMATKHPEYAATEPMKVETTDAVTA